MARDFLERVSQKTVVILGDFIHEGLRATIDGLGYTYIQRTLYDRKPKTWKKRIQTIRQLQESGNLVGVILYLPTPLFIYGCAPEFAEVWVDLVEELSRHKSIAFIFEDNLAGKFGFWDYESGQLLDYDQTKAKYEKLDSLRDDSVSERKISRLWFAIKRMEQVREMAPEIDRFLETLVASSIEIAPFRSRANVTIRIREFLQYIDGGVFLRLYVPNGRYQSQQLDSFLRIFESYLRQVEGIKFSIDSGKTEHGVIYTFRSSDAFEDSQGFQDALTRFDGFMSLCKYEPGQAETILQNMGVDSTEAAYIVNRYSKNYQRVVMDAKHELEYKKLVLRQRLESEVFELASGNLLPTPLPEHTSPFISLSHNIGPITISLPQVSVRDNTAIQSVVGQLVHGDITYNEEDRQLIALFNQYASQLEAIQLQSDLEQLKDESTPQNTNLTAKQKILAFLQKTAKVTGNATVKIATDVLAEYLKKLSTGTL